MLGQGSLSVSSPWSFQPWCHLGLRASGPPFLPDAATVKGRWLLLSSFPFSAGWERWPLSAFPPRARTGPVWAPKTVGFQLCGCGKGGKVSSPSRLRKASLVTPKGNVTGYVTGYGRSRNRYGVSPQTRNKQARNASGSEAVLPSPPMPVTPAREIGDRKPPELRADRI